MGVQISAVLPRTARRRYLEPVSYPSRFTPRELQCEDSKLSLLMFITSDLWLLEDLEVGGIRSVTGGIENGGF